MIPPTIDCHGYPDERCLEALKTWDIHDTIGAFDYACELFKLMRYGTFVRRGAYLRMATGGWSGCEDVIYALKSNIVVWMISWVSSTRGGLHVFQPGFFREDGS